MPPTYTFSTIIPRSLTTYRADRIQYQPIPAYMSPQQPYQLEMFAYSGLWLDILEILNLRISKLEKWLMAKKFAKPNGDFGVDFINRPLLEAEKDHFKEWFSKLDNDFDEVVGAFILEGFKLSLTWDDNNQCVIASMTCKDEQSPNYNKVLTSRGNQPLETLCMCFYKHVVIFHSGKWEQNTQRNWG